MKIYRYMLAAIFAAVMISCVDTPEVGFGVEVGTEDGRILIGPEGGVKTINVTSPG